MVRVVTDSTSDLPDDVAVRMGISVVPVVLEVDGTTYLDGVSITRQQFYSCFTSYRDVPKTASPPLDDFLRVYRAMLTREEDEVVAVHLNKRFSSLCNVADLAARELNVNGKRVHVVNSETVTMGLGWLTIVAAEMAANGSTAQEIIRRIEELKPKVIVYALIDTLKYLRKGGRANALVAGLGDILQIKILIRVHRGEITQIDRIRTRARGMARLVEVAHSHTKLSHLSVLSTTTGAENDVTILRKQLGDLVPIDQQFTMQVTPVIGTHVGPLALGVAMAIDV